MCVPLSLSTHPSNPNRASPEDPAPQKAEDLERQQGSTHTHYYMQQWWDVDYRTCLLVVPDLESTEKITGVRIDEQQMQARKAGARYALRSFFFLATSKSYYKESTGEPLPWGLLFKIPDLKLRHLYPYPQKKIREPKINGNMNKKQTQKKHKVIVTPP